MAKETELHTNTQKPQNCKNKRKICVKLINCVETLCFVTFIDQQAVKQNVMKLKFQLRKKQLNCTLYAKNCNNANFKQVN